MRVPANGSEKQKRHSDSYADGFDELLHCYVGMEARGCVGDGFAASVEASHGRTMERNPFGALTVVSAAIWPFFDCCKF